MTQLATAVELQQQTLEPERARFGARIRDAASSGGKDGDRQWPCGLLQRQIGWSIPTIRDAVEKQSRVATAPDKAGGSSNA